MTEVELEPLRLKIEQLISKELLNQSQCRIIEDLIYRTAKVDIEGLVWARKDIYREVKWSTPSSWWQHFKQACYQRNWVVPKWWKQRWPVKETVKEFNVKELYPEFRASVPDYRAVLCIPNPPGKDVWL